MHSTGTRGFLQSGLRSRSDNRRCMLPFSDWVLSPASTRSSPTLSKLKLTNSRHDSSQYDFVAVPSARTATFKKVHSSAAYFRKRFIWSAKWYVFKALAHKKRSVLEWDYTVYGDDDVIRVSDETVPSLPIGTGFLFPLDIPVSSAKNCETRV